MPYRICFDVPADDFFFYLESIMDLFFIVDIIITFNSGYYYRGIKVLKRK